MVEYVVRFLMVKTMWVTFGGRWEVGSRGT